MKMKSAQNANPPLTTHKDSKIFFFVARNHVPLLVAEFLLHNSFCRVEESIVASFATPGVTSAAAV